VLVIIDEPVGAVVTSAAATGVWRGRRRPITPTRESLTMWTSELRTIVRWLGMFAAAAACVGCGAPPSLGGPPATLSPPPEPASGAGREWRLVDTSGLEGAFVHSVMAYGDLLIAAGSTQDFTGAIWTSADGVGWELAGPANFFEGSQIRGLVAWDGGVMALGSDRSLAYRPPPVVLTSPDGRVWEESSVDACSGDFYELSAAAANGAPILIGMLGRQPGGGAVCLVAGERPVLPSEELFQGSLLTDIAVSGTSVLVVGTKNAVGVPTDPAIGGAWLSRDSGQSFSEVPLSDGTLSGESEAQALPGGAGGVALMDDGFLVVGTHDGPVAWVSTDGTTWEMIKLGPSGGASDVVRGAAGFVAVGSFGSSSDPIAQAWVSHDGRVWEATPIPANEGVVAHTVIAWGAGYLAVGGTNSLWVSP
jgi:hypothetical protein